MAKKAKAPKKVSIKSVIQASGLYCSAFDVAIDGAEQLLSLRDKVYNQIKNEDPRIEEVSRENDIRYKANPAYTQYLEICKELRAVLGELQLTPKSSSISEGDAIDELNRKLRQIANEDN